MARERGVSDAASRVGSVRRRADGGVGSSSFGWGARCAGRAGGAQRAGRREGSCSRERETGGFESIKRQFGLAASDASSPRCPIIVSLASLRSDREGVWRGAHAWAVTLAFSEYKNERGATVHPPFPHAQAAE